MKKLLLNAFILLCAISVQADSYTDSIRSLDGTIESTFEEQTVQGKLQNCSLGYKNIVFDHSYYKGAPFVVHGSIGVALNARDQMLTSLKVITNKMQPTKGGLEMRPQRPYFAYLKSPYGVTNVSGFISKTNSDTPGGIFEVFNFDDSFLKILDGIIESQKVIVVFNRHKGGMDVQVPVDLSVVDAKNDGTKVRDANHLLEFVNCVQKLAKRAK